MKRTKKRIYWRERGGAKRGYADFRDYKDVGGSQEALKVPGESYGTTDPGLAEVLAAKRLDELNTLRTRRQGRTVAGLPKETTITALASEHLKAKAQSGKFTDRWLASSERQLG